MSALLVWMEGELVGTLDGRDKRNLHFSYEPSWSAAAGATPLSVQMPLAGGRFGGQRLSCFLWGLLPDNERVLQRWARTYQCSAKDVFGLLRGVGRDVAGAAQFLEPDVEPDEGGDGTVEPLDEAEIAALLRALRRDVTAWHPSNGGRWSLAGAQAKIALAWDPSTARWGVASGSAPTTHIFKPSIDGLDHHDLNEHLCLSTARALGLIAARSSVEHFEDETALVVQRYDRMTAGGAVRRIHQEDCCQALAVHPEAKYQSDGGPAIADVAALLRSVEIPDAQPDIDRLLRAVAFNWLILGTDGHAKNLSLLLSGAQVRLAPLYDLASALPYGSPPRRLKLAQKVGGEYRPTALGARHWKRLAKETRSDPDHLLTVVGELADALPDALRSTAAATSLTAAERKVAGRFCDLIVGWVGECRTALDHGPTY